MIKPESYYAAHKEASTPEELGRIGFALVGREAELNPPLSGAEKLLVQTIARCNKWHTENREALKDKWREKKRGQRAKEPMSPDVPETTGDNQCPRDNGGQPMSPTLPTILPTIHPTTHSINTIPLPLPFHSPEDAPKNGNGNGMVEIEIEGLPGGLKEARARCAAFKRDLAKNGDGEFFSPDHDVVTICSAVVGDLRSIKRWRQLANAKGEGAIRQELFAFYRELASGETVQSRGAALNARLNKLTDLNDSN